MASVPNWTCDEPETFGRSLFGRPSSGSYKTAVTQIVRNIKAAHKLSNARLAEILGCAEQTIANADSDYPENELKAVTLLNIAYAFGEDAISPVRQLYLCAPTEQPTIEDRLDRIEREAAAIRKEMES
jgi:transcriptional regulator with XRE-family HTH domain